MERKIVYMDNSSATRMDEKVLEAMMPYYFDVYAVASSEFGYSLGIEAKEALDGARETIGKRVNAEAESIVFTSGSTESSNMALKGVAMALANKKGKHIIVSKIEDFPVLNSAKHLERQGFSVTYLDVGADGRVDPSVLSDSIKKDTILVSIQHANQEIGTIQDIGEIGRICHERDVIFHTDATHSFTRVPVDVQSSSVDLMTISAHTIHGPKGIGALYVRPKTIIEKWMDGGYQERDRRAGLENIPGALGFAKATELVSENENERLRKMRDHLIERIMMEVSHVTLNGNREKRVPQNANITFHYVEGESITLHMDLRGFSLSTGSACFSKSLEASHVIRGIGGDHERAHGSVRFTLGRYNSMNEVDSVVENISEVINKLREISPLMEKG
ncbi:MAG: cysteine desulfurase [Candidatus Methanofastidiosa archaeon]|nr:cysteine desulfurase [Candidatus Methanofastidiosa archaeon]